MRLVTLSLFITFQPRIRKMIQKSGFHFEKEGAGPHVVMNDRPAVVDDTNDMEVSADELYVEEDDQDDEKMDDSD